MYVALINMMITNTKSKTVTIYEKWFVKIQDAEIAKYNKRLFSIWESNTYNYFRKEVDCDVQGECRTYWLKIEQVLPNLFEFLINS